MKKVLSLLSIVLVMASLFALSGCGGEKKYIDTFLEQISKGEDVIKLVEDVIAGESDITIPKGTSLDLNGLTVDVKNFVMQSNDSGEYTLKNGVIKVSEDLKVLLKNATINLEDIKMIVEADSEVVFQASDNTLNIGDNTSITNEDGDSVEVDIEEGTRVVVSEGVTEDLNLNIVGNNVTVENNSNASGNTYSISEDVTGRFTIINEGSIDSITNDSADVSIIVSSPSSSDNDPITQLGEYPDSITEELIDREITFYNSSEMVEMFVYKDGAIIEENPVDWNFVDDNTKEFVAWYTTPDFKEESKVTYPYTVTSNEDWFAKLGDRTSATITFSVYLHNITSGEYQDINIAKEVEIGESVELPTLEELNLPEGYEIENWLDFEGNISTFPIVATSDVQFVGQIDYKSIKFDVNFVVGNKTTTITAYYEQEISAPDVSSLITLYGEGYYFERWTQVGDYAVLETVVFPLVVTGEQTYTAELSDLYSVTAHSNDLTLDDEVKYNENIDFTAFSNMEYLENYEFVGWFTEDGINGVWGDEVTEATVVTEDMDIYAQFVEIGKMPEGTIIILDANGGEFENGKDVFYITKDSDLWFDDNGDGNLNNIYLSELPIPSREGYMIENEYGDIRWYDMNGEVVYDIDKDNLTEPITLSVNWIEAITINLNAGYGMVHDIMFYRGYDMYQQNYLHLYPKGAWIALEFGDITMNQVAPDEFNESDNRIFIPYLWKYGYTMRGWSYDEAGNDMVDFNSPIYVEEDITLYLQWTKLPELTFINNGEIEVFQVYESSNRDIIVDIPNDPVVAGKSFYGWWEMNGDSYLQDLTTSYNTQVNAIGYFDGGRFIPTEDKTYYARYLSDEITLNYDANGGEFKDGDLEVTTILSRSSIAGNDGAFSVLNDTYLTEAVIKYRTSYQLGEKCIGWALTADGGVLSNTDINETLDARIMAGEKNITLYAVWESYGECTYDDGPMIIFDANGGTFDGLYTQLKRPCYQISSGSYYYPKSDTHTLFNLTKEGYVLLGWDDDASVDEPYWNVSLDRPGYYQGDLKLGSKETSDKTVYAIWGLEVAEEPNELPIFTFDANGGLFINGESSIEKQVYPYEYSNTVYKTYIDNEYVYLDGKLLLGWYSVNGGNSDLDFDWGEKYEEEFLLKPTEAMTYYARWADGAKYTFDANGGRINNGYMFDSVESIDIYAEASHNGFPVVTPRDIFNENGMLFVGWFTKDGTNSDWGEEIKIGYNNETGEDYPVELIDRTLYAKWVAFEDLPSDFNFDFIVM